MATLPKFNKVEKYLLNVINSEDVVLTTDAQKIAYLFKCFTSEAVHNRAGINVMAEWLSGLPSCINIIYTYYDISQFLECKEDSVKVQRWFNTCAIALHSIKTKIDNWQAKEFKPKKYYVTMTDKFMSGWGMAYNKTNKLVIECNSMDDAIIIERNARKRSEMKYVNIVYKKPCYNSKKVMTSHKQFSEMGEIWKK